VGHWCQGGLEKVGHVLQALIAYHSRTSFNGLSSCGYQSYAYKSPARYLLLYCYDRYTKMRFINRGSASSAERWLGSDVIRGLEGDWRHTRVLRIASSTSQRLQKQRLLTKSYCFLLFLILLNTNTTFASPFFINLYRILHGYLFIV